MFPEEAPYSAWNFSRRLPREVRRRKLSMTLRKKIDAATGRFRIVLKITHRNGIAYASIPPYMISPISVRNFYRVATFLS